MSGILYQIVSRTLDSEYAVKMIAPVEHVQSKEPAYPDYLRMLHTPAKKESLF